MELRLFWYIGARCNSSIYSTLLGLSKLSSFCSKEKQTLEKVIEKTKSIQS